MKLRNQRAYYNPYPTPQLFGKTSPLISSQACLPPMDTRLLVDIFSKSAHFGELLPHFTAFKAAHLFLDMVCKHHNFPRSIVSDSDPIFISKFWQELFNLCGTKLRMSTSYHPETEGQIEVLNCVLEQYLRSFGHKQPATWSAFYL